MSGGGLVRLGGVCGLLFVLLVGAGIHGRFSRRGRLLPPARGRSSDTPAARQATSCYSTGRPPLLATFFFLWFLGVLYGMLRRAEGVDGVLSTVVLVGGTLFITLPVRWERGRDHAPSDGAEVRQLCT